MSHALINPIKPLKPIRHAEFLETVFLCMKVTTNNERKLVNNRESKLNTLIIIHLINY